MEAKVVSIDGNCIQVETAIGTFSGVWCDGEPIKNKNYILELDCPEIISRQQVLPAEENRFLICQSNGKTELFGKVENVEGPVLVFRLKTALVMIETTCPETFYDCIGKFVCISLSKIDLYDTGII